MTASTNICILLLLLCVHAMHSSGLSIIEQKQYKSIEQNIQPTLQRVRRQFDFTLSAEHDDKEDETEVALEAIASLWRSEDGNTQVDGSAKVVHRSNTLDTGNTRYKAQFHVHHNYKKK